MIRMTLLSMMFAFPTVVAAQAMSGTGGELRVLDKVTGEVTDLSMLNGATQQLGNLKVTLQDCRFPKSNPTGDAYAQVSVLYREDVEPVFQGWLIASAPALNAMDHPRYDVWALRCTRS